MKNKDFADTVSLPWYFLSNPMQVQKYFLEMKSKMPSLSPIDKNWPPRPYLFLDSTHKELKRIFHLWRVKSLFSLEASHRGFVLCVCEESCGRERPPPLPLAGRELFEDGGIFAPGTARGFREQPWSSRRAPWSPPSREGVSSFPFRFRLP